MDKPIAHNMTITVQYRPIGIMPADFMGDEQLEKAYGIAARVVGYEQAKLLELLEDQLGFQISAPDLGPVPTGIEMQIAACVTQYMAHIAVEQGAQSAIYRIGELPWLTVLTGESDDVLRVLGKVDKAFPGNGTTLFSYHYSSAEFTRDTAPALLERIRSAMAEYQQ